MYGEKMRAYFETQYRFDVSHNEKTGIATVSFVKRDYQGDESTPLFTIEKCDNGNFDIKLLSDKVKVMSKDGKGLITDPVKE